jgi:hypothetical protein
VAGTRGGAVGIERRGVQGKPACREERTGGLMQETRSPSPSPTSPKPLSHQGVDWWVRLSPMVLGDRDDNLGTGTRYPSGIRPDGYGYADDFYPRVTPVLDPNRDGYGMSIFFQPQVTRRVYDTLLPI